MMDGETDFCSVMMMIGKYFFEFFSLQYLPTWICLRRLCCSVPHS